MSWRREAPDTAIACGIVEGKRNARLDPRADVVVFGAVAFVVVFGLLIEHEAPDSYPIAFVLWVPAFAAGLLVKRLSLVLLGALAFLTFAALSDPEPAGEDLIPVMLGLLTGAALRLTRPQLRAGHGQASRLVVRAQQAVALPPPLRRLIDRPAIDAAIDLARLRLDLFPHGLYQPVASLPVTGTAKRADGCRSRWEAMRPFVIEHRVRTAVDVGANAGYFSLELAALGVPTTAIECDPALYRTALLAVRRSELDNVAVMALELRPDAMELLPPADAMLCLSVWHHLVRSNGLDAATAMLRDIWARTGKVLFFDTGEAEMPASFGLPAMVPDARAWLTGLLRGCCEGGEVRLLGLHDAFDAAGRSCRRHLFAVVRGV